MLEQRDAAGHGDVFDIPEALDIALVAQRISTAGGLREAAALTVAYAIEVTGARWAEVVAARDSDGLEVLATTDEAVTRVLLEARRHSDVGPSIPGQGDAVGTIVIDDLRTDTRWPAFATSVASRTSVRSAVLQYLVVGERYAAVLPVYDDRPGYFDADRTRRIQVLAELAGPALAGLASHEQANQLAVALQSNRDIATALGIVMSTRAVTRPVAFDLLRAVSQRSQRKLKDVADEVVRTGSLPDR